MVVLQAFRLSPRFLLQVSFLLFSADLLLLALADELWLLYFPFSSLMHSFTFVPSRLFTGAWFARRGIDALAGGVLS